MIRLAAIAVVVALAGCWQDHFEGAVQTSRDGCPSCHLHDYQNATAPIHEGNFPRTCGDCHATNGWQPAIEGLHPSDARFSINGGPHGDVACLECHDPGRGPSADGANTLCAGCHTHRRSEADGQHDGVDEYAWQDADPSFCLGCHLDGRHE